MHRLALCAACAGGLSLAAVAPAHADDWASRSAADFWNGSSATLEARQFYFNREFHHQPAPRPGAVGLAQAFIFQFNSGYTAGPVGLGVDLLGQAGYRLHGGAGTNIMPYRTDGSPENEYAKLRPTYKAKLGKTTVKYGTFVFNDPFAISDYTRLLQATYKGWLVESHDLDRLALIGARLSGNQYANATHYSDFVLNRYPAYRSDKLVMGGGTYSFPGALGASATYRYIWLDGIYRQSFYGLKGSWHTGAGQSLSGDLRYHVTRPDGGSRAPVDNRAVDAMLTYKLGGAAFGVGYQHMGGRDPFPYLARSTAYLINFVTINDFANAHERSWQYRFDYDFARLGLPGLTFMTRYTAGDHIDRGAGLPAGREWERNTDIGYAFPGGPLKGFSLRWRNTAIRSSYAAANRFNENRLILDYVLALK
ncbi:OprD family outer membrane porin [Frateuria defendens]|uniref:OprD family outer membrane porin n=1 Tax=Frateuria defendens TaxID=2219559 RepID=UPI00066FE34B|nr:OprD family outer membrane porin [Frateuria defendens]